MQTTPQKKSLQIDNTFIIRGKERRRWETETHESCRALHNIQNISYKFHTNAEISPDYLPMKRNCH